MSDQRDQQGRTGQSDHPQHRADTDEGVRSPMAQETGSGPIEHSIFDGEGNEIVVVTTDDDAGRRVQGTGPSAEKAMKDAQTGDEQIGTGFGTDHSYKG